MGRTLIRNRNDIRWQKKEMSIDIEFESLHPSKSPIYLIRRRSADATYPRRFADIQISSLIRRIMPQERSGNIVGGHLRPADAFPFGACVIHPRSNSCAYHSQFQLTEHARHLKKRLTHRVRLSVPAVKGDAADDDKPQILFP